MSESSSYESWRAAWERYGAAVCAVAAALDGPVRASAEIESMAAEAIRSGAEIFDPLEAFLVPVLRDRSAAQRREAAAVLAGEGIPEARAVLVTGSKARPAPVRVPAVSTGGSPMAVPPFDRVMARIATLAPALPRRRAGATADGDASRWWRVGPPFVALCAVLMLVAGSVSFAGLRAWRSRGGAPKVAVLVWPAQLPTPWSLVQAQSVGPVEMRTSTPFAQRFVDRGHPERSVALRVTARESTQFVQAALGPVPPPAAASPDSGELLGTRRVQLSVDEVAPTWAYWPENDADVDLQATGMRRTELAAFIAGLVVRTDVATEGFDPPDSRWVETSASASEVTFWTPATTATFRAAGTGPGGGVHVTVTSTPQPQATTPTSAADRLLGTASAKGESVRLTNGATASLLTGRGAGATLHWWDSRRHMAIDMAATADDPRALTAAEVADVEALAGVLRLGDAADWRTATTSLQNEMLLQPVVARVALGPLELTYRLFNAPDRKASIVCTPTMCEPWDFDAASAVSADLIVDGHWWHLERVGTHAPLPAWRTIPSDEGLPEHTVVVRDQLWRALDLGVDTKVLRRNSDPTAFGRPPV